ncbi:MAG TPA: hypothetical protein DCQ50_11750 [Chryseobacterium sp.]|nr:hypothetical protein [Chryseobacterium sp.]
MNNTVYDIVGIGIGPFNLGLAALCHPIKELKTIFFEQKPEFSWHEGIMIPNTTLQVSYLADLVTLADPSSKFSYLNFLRDQNRLMQFGIYEHNTITRSEYNRYCKWVCSKLQNLRFGVKVMNVQFNTDSETFRIEAGDECSDPIVCYAKHIVVGVGTVPRIPEVAKEYLGDNVIHSSQYLDYKRVITESKKIMLVGSGQSAAEIFYDLLNNSEYNRKNLSWLTRSDHFYSMEHNKLVYEMASPGYIDYFFDLDPSVKYLLLSQQGHLYKGINHHLINAIYDKLYNGFIEGGGYCASIRMSMALDAIIKINRDLRVTFRHRYLNKKYSEAADFIILATGYEYQCSSCLLGVKELFKTDEVNLLVINRNYSIDECEKIFVQNAEMHTHGFNAPDLSLGAYRNSVIINSICGRQHYPVDQDTTFQRFGLAS